MMTIAATGFSDRTSIAQSVETAVVAAGQGVGDWPERGGGGEEIIGAAVVSAPLRGGAKGILPAAQYGAGVAAGGFGAIVRQALAAPGAGAGAGAAAAPGAGDGGVAAAPVVVTGIDAQGVLIAQAAVNDKVALTVGGLARNDGALVVPIVPVLAPNSDLAKESPFEPGDEKVISVGVRTGPGIAPLVGEAGAAAPSDDVADLSGAGDVFPAVLPDGGAAKGLKAVIAPSGALSPGNATASPVAASVASPEVSDAKSWPAADPATADESTPRAARQRNAAIGQSEPAEDAILDEPGLVLPQPLVAAAQQQLAAVPIAFASAESGPKSTARTVDAASLPFVPKIASPASAPVSAAGQTYEAAAAAAAVAGHSPPVTPAETPSTARTTGIGADSASQTGSTESGSAALANDAATALTTQRVTGGSVEIQRIAAAPQATSTGVMVGDAVPTSVAANRSVGGSTRSFLPIAGTLDGEDVAKERAVATSRPVPEAVPEAVPGQAVLKESPPVEDSITAAVSGERIAVPRQPVESATPEARGQTALPATRLPAAGDLPPILAAAPHSAEVPAPPSFLVASAVAAVPVAPGATSNPPVPVPVSIVLPVQPEKLAHDVGVALAQRLGSKGDELRIRLEPADFGTIEIRMTFDHRGALRAVVGADSGVALDLLRRDSAELGRALSDAGIRADGDSFRFESRGQDRGDGGQRQPRHDAQPANARAEASGTDIPDPTRFRPLRWRGAVDVMA